VHGSTHTQLLLLTVLKPLMFLPIPGIKPWFPSYRAHSLDNVLNELTVQWHIRHYPRVIQSTLSIRPVGSHTDGDKPWRQVTHDVCTDAAQYLNGHIKEIRKHAQHQSSPSQEGLELIMQHTGSRCVNTVNHHEMEKQIRILSELLTGNTISLGN
jgi:hypothetical protein